MLRDGGGDDGYGDDGGGEDGGGGGGGQALRDLYRHASARRRRQQRRRRRRLMALARSRVSRLLPPSSSLSRRIFALTNAARRFRLL